MRSVTRIPGLTFYTPMTMSKIVETKYYYSVLSDVHTAIIHFDHGPSVLTEEGEQLTRPFLVIRISQETMGQFRCKTVRDANILLVDGSKISNKGEFHTALHRVQQAIEFIINEHTVEKDEGATKNEAMLLRHVPSHLLEKLRNEALDEENYQLAAYVRDEVDRRIEKGFMERLPDGTARALDINPNEPEA